MTVETPETIGQQRPNFVPENISLLIATADSVETRSPRGPGPWAGRASIEFLAAENDSLRLLLEQAGIDAEILLAQAGIDAKEREAPDQKHTCNRKRHRIAKPADRHQH
jgi:hypothetical protein